MNLKTTLTLTVIATLIILSAGCIEYTVIDEDTTQTTKVTTKPIIIDNGINKSIGIKTTMNIDYYDKDGFHITGTQTYIGDKLIKIDGYIDGYSDGVKITGTITLKNNKPYYNMQCKFDTYKNGLHYLGTTTMKGDVNNPDSVCYNVIINGYSNGYPVSGSMTGCNPNIKMIMTVHTPYGDITETEYITYPY